MKANDALKTIGEVADELGVATHVLRFWEKKFNQIKPQKRRGRRYYSTKDVRYLSQIKSLLYAQGYTIKGAQNFIKESEVAQIKKQERMAANDINEQPKEIKKEDEPLELVQVVPSKALTKEDVDFLQSLYDGLNSIKDRLHNLKSFQA